MKKIIILLVTIWFSKVTIAQNDNELIDFGRPFSKATIVNLNMTVPSKNCNDKTAVLIDLGETDANDNPINCFKVLFVDLQSKTCESISLQNSTESSTVTGSIGKPSFWSFGHDGNIYVGTSNGGHIVRINYRLRKAEDLGNPLLISSNNASITSLSLGTNLALVGIIKVEGSGSYIFSYKYNCLFDILNNQPINSQYSEISQASADSYFTYALCTNGTQNKLFSIKNDTKAIEEIVSLSNNVPVANSNLRFETYIGNHVYVVNNLNNNNTYFKLIATASVSITQETPDVVAKKTSTLWPDIYKEYSNVATNYNRYTQKLSFYNQNTLEEINLDNCIQPYTIPKTYVFSPYNSLANYSSSLSGYQYDLFIHDAYGKAASFSFVKNSFTSLGNNPAGGIASAITGFDNTSVFMGAFNKVQKFDSNTPWVQSGNNPSAYEDNLYYNVSPQPNSLLAASKLKKLESQNSIVAFGTNAGKRGSQNVSQDETSLVIIEDAYPSNNTKFIYHPQFSQYYAFNKSMGVDQNNGNIIIIGNNQNSQLGSSFSHLMALDKEGSMLLEYDIYDEDNNHLYGINNIEVANNTVYFYIANILYKIDDYLAPNAVAKKMCFFSYLGSISAIGLSPNNNYVTVAVGTQGGAAYQIFVVPSDEINRSYYPYDMGNIQAVSGLIPNYDWSQYASEFAFIDNYCFLAGFKNVYGFTNNRFGSGYSDKTNKDKDLTNIFTADKTSLNIYPNPAKSSISVIYNSVTNENIQIQILNTNGSIVYNKASNTQVGKNNLDINISNLSSGTYFIKIISKSSFKTSKFYKL